MNSTNTDNPNDASKLKDSDEWCDLMQIKVLDPDGWDRSNFQHSWNEKISYQEFIRRMIQSTTAYDEYSSLLIAKYGAKYGNV